MCTYSYIYMYYPDEHLFVVAHYVCAHINNMRALSCKLCNFRNCM